MTKKITIRMLNMIKSVPTIRPMTRPGLALDGTLPSSYRAPTTPTVGVPVNLRWILGLAVAGLSDKEVIY